MDKLAKDIELIKEMIIPEGELTDWAKRDFLKDPHIVAWIILFIKNII